MTNKPETITFAAAIKEDMASYAAEVNFNRAIVDISGLKRVQLRILYTMYKMKLFPDKPRAKCPDIVGNVIQLHPHSDTSIYDAMVRLAQPWILNYPLIDLKGSVGSEDGDPAAASRYTEARLSKYGMALINNIKDTSPFVPDYADHGKEPHYLIPAFPSLFVNISKGIGVAAACNFLPHSLFDIHKVIERRINGESEDSIIRFLAPMFPTGGILVNGADLPQIYKTGRGSIKLRAKHKIDGNKIIFTELPYQVSRTSVIEMLQERKDQRIISIYDTSDMNQKSITITVRHSVNIESFVEELFKTTRLEDSFNVNMTVHNRKKVERRSFIDLIDEYIEQQHIRITAIAEKRRLTAQAKKFELEGFAIILPHIDRVYEIIRHSDTDDEASEILQSEFGIAAKQASIVLAIRLAQLTRKGIDAIKAEIAELDIIIQEQLKIEGDVDLRHLMMLSETASLIGDEKFTTTIEMGSIAQTSDIETDIMTSSGDIMSLGADEEIIVVTDKQRVYKLKGKNLDKMPKDKILLLDTPDFIDAQKSIHLFGRDIHPSIILCQAKSVRGANLKL